jgi:iron complex outermembrane receptor protein
MLSFVERRLVRTLSGVACGALALAIAMPAVAQTAQPVTQADTTPTTPSAPATALADDETPPASASSATNADIVVTGSRIKGVAAVGSAVIAIDQAKIAQEPVTSSADLLRRVPQIVGLGQNRNGGTAQNGAANATRGSGINLRGIGTNATLVLYDGKRLPPQGTQGQYTDPSVIPSIMLSRVEVVADGASAIYGSDAVAGVVNFILRKNFDGAELRARSGFTDDGAYGEQQIAGIFGKKWDGGYLTFATEYTHNAALYGASLPWYRDDNRDRGGRDLRTTFCNPGTITAAGRSYAIPLGGVTAANAGALIAGTSNKCDYNGYDAVVPEQQRISAIANFSQDIDSRLRVFADGFYSYRDGLTPGVGDTFTATVRNTNPFFVAPAPGVTSETVAYSLLPELGADQNPYHGYSWNVSGGAEAKLFGDWSATAYYQHGESKDVSDRRLGVNAVALATALADTNPATALNVVGGANNPATLARIHDNYFQIIGATRLDVANLQFTGSLFHLPGGNVRTAIGGEYRKEYTFTNLVMGSSTAQRQIADAGSRNVKAVFAELYVPIFGAANAIPGFQQLTVSLAGRYEHYSNFGDTKNPKVGVTWKPIHDLTVRGSYGTSFRAPTFTEISQVAGGAGLYYDTLPGANGNQTGIGIAGGNPGLKPETATTWSAGFEYAPSFAPGLTATATYFDIDYKNQINALRGTSGILVNPLYASFVTLNPTAAQVAALIGSGLPINQAINASTVTFIVDGRRQNLGEALVRGVDFGLNYAHTFGAVKIDTGVQGTYFTHYGYSPVPGAAFSNVINTINFPQKFRVQADVGATVGAVHGRVTLNHLSGYANTGVSPFQHVSAYDTVDLYLGLDVTPRLTLSVDARNLFNRNPPFVDQVRGYDPQSTNPIPRLISVTAGVKF